MKHSGHAFCPEMTHMVDRDLKGNSWSLIQVLRWSGCDGSAKGHRSMMPRDSQVLNIYAQKIMTVMSWQDKLHQITNENVIHCSWHTSAYV